MVPLERFKTQRASTKQRPSQGQEAESPRKVRWETDQTFIGGGIAILVSLRGLAGYLLHFRLQAKTDAGSIKPTAQKVYWN